MGVHLSTHLGLSGLFQVGVAGGMIGERRFWWPEDMVNLIVMSD